MKKSFLFLLFLGLSSVLMAQNLSNRGKEFWVGYGHHYFMEDGSNSQTMVIYLSAEQAATVTISIYGTAYTQVINVPANSVVASAPIPKTGANDARLFTPGGISEGIYNNKGIRITSNVPIVAYAHIYGSASSGATMLLPTDTWGYSYITLNSRQAYMSNCFSWAYVIAKEDKTVIEVTPSKNTRTGNVAGNTFTIQLNKGQIYQFMAGPETSSAKDELTGSTIKSVANEDGECFPIAVFSGSSRTYNQFDCGGSGGGDNDNQQCFPYQAWGKRYLTAPTATSNSPTTRMLNAFKIIVKDPTTVVTRNGVPIPQSSLQPGNFYYFETNIPQYIVADKPVMVGQFMSGGTCSLISGVGDPEMIYISPIEQGIKRVGFYRNNRESITTNLLNIIIPTGGVPSLRIDGSTVFTTTYPHPNLPGYTVVVKSWPASPTQCIVTSDSAFTAITYGLGSVESYGYNAGTMINNLNVLSNVRNQADTSVIRSHPFTCKQSPATLSVLVAYQPTNILWQLNVLAGVMSPATNMNFPNPTPSGTQVINGTTYYEYPLPGTYIFSDTGEYQIPIKLTHPSIDNCSNTETVMYTVKVKSRPNPNFDIVHSGCLSDTVRVLGPDSTTNSYTIGQWVWTLPGGLTSHHQDTSFMLSTGGTHPISLHLVTTEGCVSDTTKNIVVAASPINTLSATPASGCPNTSVTFTPTVTYNGTGTVGGHYWNFGDGSVLTNVAAGPQSHTYTNPGTYIVKYTNSLTSACTGDTARFTIRIFQKPVASFTFPQGCLPANGIVQFTGLDSTADGQQIATHSWTFGDASSTPTNPNTATIKNPTHTYPSYGNYTITYSVTTVNGCSDDTTVNATLNLAPVLQFNALPAVCENSTASISVAQASVTNSVPGTGVYVGPGTSSTGSFNPAAAGPGTHTIWYVYNATSGCRDSISRTITVNPAPRANFTLPGAACLSPAGTVQFTFTGGNVAGQTYNWNFGDNTTPSTVQNPSHNYASSGNYSINLAVTTPAGCVDDTTYNATFNIKPVITYPALNAICQEAAATSIATATVTNVTGGTWTYTGSGVGAGNMFNPATAGPGTHTITSIYTANGCSDTATRTILVNPSPRANFTIPGTGCLDPSGLVQFNFTGSNIAGQTYNWTFGDNTPNSNVQNPSHNYTTSGNYAINLAMTTPAGCVDDTTYNATFNIKPVITYPALNAICEEASAVSIATATVSNAPGGTWAYTGAGVGTGNMFTPATAGPGNHVITSIYTANGCSDTATSSIRVYARPVATYSLSTENLCQGNTLTFTNASTSADGAITQWNWNLGDGTTQTLTNGASFTHAYNTVGTVPITLSVQSSNGCVSTVNTQQLNVRANPVAAFTVPTSVCMPGGTVQLTNTTTVADASTISYNWNLGDGNTSTQTNPSHIFSTITGYNIHLTATTQYGCVDDTTVLFSSFFDKPVAYFTVSDDTLCQGTKSIFTDSSYAPNSTITSFNWSFGDGTNSTVRSPNKIYANAGVFPVTLSVANAQGCKSDPFTKNVMVFVQPFVDAGKSFFVADGSTVQFMPTVNNYSLDVQWSPAQGLSNANALMPYHYANGPRVYTITVTSIGGCTASDSLTVNVYRNITIPNAFSPNGDGVNDTWQITNLTDYPSASVEVYNRYGQMVYRSPYGYNKAWDGRMNGKMLPFGVYYYIIDLKNGSKPLNGSITIVK